MGANYKNLAFISLLPAIFCYCLFVLALPAKAEQPDFGPYMSMLQRRIKSGWYPPKSRDTRSAEVKFSVSKEGHISNVHISRSSASAEVDESCIKAVEQADPALPLPEGAPPSVDVQFSFDFNVFKDGKRLPSLSEDGGVPGAQETNSGSASSGASSPEDLFAPGGSAVTWKLYSAFTEAFSIIAITLGPLLLIIGGLLLSQQKRGGRLSLIIGVSLIISLFLTPLMKRIVSLLLDSLN